MRSRDRDEEFGPPVPDHRTERLCHAVAERLNLLFGGGCADDVLQDLAVETVRPDPTAGRLRVVVRPQGADADPAVILARLAHAKGLLRAEIASAIRRKRAPDLTFQIVLADDAEA